MRAPDMTGSPGGRSRVSIWAGRGAISAETTADRRVLLLNVARVVLAIGGAIRVVEYAMNRSLSIDESFLALNLLEKSPASLLHALNFDQAAPLGFLEVEKLVIGLFGKSEYALRVVPLLVSLASLALFYKAAKKLVHIAALPYACAAFALFDPLVYYGATAKQYSLDVAAAVMLYAVAALSPGRDPLTRTDVVKLTSLGAAAVWFSHASVFVLAAIGVTLLVEGVGFRRWDRLMTVGLVGAAALISFGIELHLSRANLARIEHSFHPTHGLLTTGSATGSGWFDSATARFRYLVGLEDTATGFPILGSLPHGVNRGLTVLICLVALAGFFALVRRRARAAMLIGIPPILVLIVSAFHKYPLVGRTLLFLLPSVALCLGEGIRALVSGPRWRVVGGGTVAAVSLTAIALLPTLHLFEARAGEGVRPALRELGRHYQRSDTLYVGHFAQYGLVYYHLCGCAAFDPRRAWPFTLAGGPSRAAPAMVSQTRNLIVGSPIQSAAIDRREVRLLRGRRIWVLISQEPGTYLGFLAALGHSGRELYRFGPFGGRGTGAWLYLFDLGAPPD